MEVNYQQNSYWAVIGVHSTMHLMHPNYCQITIISVCVLLIVSWYLLLVGENTIQPATERNANCSQKAAKVRGRSFCCSKFSSLETYIIVCNYSRDMHTCAHINHGSIVYMYIGAVMNTEWHCLKQSKKSKDKK